mmetsp:Transcript_6982/g.6165  ORF Transcript_6982/g.6165 Transcript_6982/m.6165 type:complete len:210 (+) Transcript_6982:625-1254(+)
MFRTLCKADRGEIFLCLLPGVSTMLQQDFDGAELVLARRPMQRRESTFVCGVDKSTTLQQQVHDLYMAFPDSKVERCITASIVGANVDASLQQDTHHRSMACASSQVKRRHLLPVRGIQQCTTATTIARCYQKTHRPIVTGVGSPVQGRPTVDGNLRLSLFGIHIAIRGIHAFRDWLRVPLKQTKIHSGREEAFIIARVDICTGLHEHL